MGDMGELGEDAAAMHAEVGAFAQRRAASTGCWRWARRAAQRCRPSARAASTSPTLDAAARGRAREDAPGATILVKGSRFMQMERVAEALWHPEEAAMLLELSQWLSTKDARRSTSSTYITLRVVLAALTALADLLHRRPDDDPQAHRLQDRPGGARRRPADAPHQDGHADDGRRADPGVGRDHHAALGGPAEPLRVDRAAHHAGLRRRRLGGRLAQGRAPQSQGPLGEVEVLLAVGDRRGRRLVPRLQREAAAADRAHRAVLQVGRDPAGHGGLRDPRLLRGRRAPRTR